MSMSAVALWFLSVVVAGIAVNLMSDYLKPKVDIFLGTWSASRRMQNRQRREAVRERALEMLQDPQKFTYHTVLFTRDSNFVNTAVVVMILLGGFIFGITLILDFRFYRSVQYSFLGTLIDIKAVYITAFVILILVIFISFTIYFVIILRRVTLRRDILDEYWKLKEESKKNMIQNQDISDLKNQ